MYFVNSKTFPSIEAAFSECKRTPSTIVTDTTGTVLMKHVPVSEETLRNINLARRIMKMQLLYRTKRA
jgi:hypothetical protein